MTGARAEAALACRVIELAGCRAGCGFVANRILTYPHEKQLQQLPATVAASAPRRCHSGGINLASSRLYPELSGSEVLRRQLQRVPGGVDQGRRLALALKWRALVKTLDVSGTRREIRLYLFSTDD